MKNKDRNKPDTIFIPIHLIVMFIMLILGIASAFSASENTKLFNIYSKGNYVLEYATIIRYEEDIHRGKFIDYVTYYEYVSPDGTIYTGLHEARIKTEEEAKAQIGKKVPVYIDHELKLQKKDFSLGGTWFYGAMSFICFGIFLNSFIREILNIKKRRRYKQSSKDAKENEDLMI